MHVAGARGNARRSVRVSILSANPKTLDELQAYLGAVGVAAHCVRTVDEFEKAATEPGIAAILFPDDFPRNEVLKLIEHVRSAQPRLLALLVTRMPQHFRPPLDADSRSHPTVFLARPCFSWEILDVIRTRSRGDRL